jgi:hypothetical protein
MTSKPPTCLRSPEPPAPLVAPDIPDPLTDETRYLLVSTILGNAPRPDKGFLRAVDPTVLWV